MSGSNFQLVPGLEPRPPARSIPDSSSGIRPGPLMWMLFWMVTGTTTGVVLALLIVSLGFELNSGLRGDRVHYSGCLWGAELFSEEGPPLRSQYDLELKHNLERRWRNFLRAGLAIPAGLFGLIMATSLCLRSGMAALQARLEAWERVQKRKERAHEVT